MKKIFKIIFTFTSLVSINLKADFQANGHPVLFRYQDKLQDTVFQTSIAKEFAPEALINVIPHKLLMEILNHLNIKADRPKEQLLSEIRKRNIKFIFDSAIWKPSSRWLDNRYNVVFHRFAQKWPLTDGHTLKNFAFDVPMGLFSANGVYEVNNGSSITFNKFTPRNVNYHDRHYSPKTAEFYLEAGRQVATFWTAAIPPDKKNVIVIFNTMIGRNDFENELPNGPVKIMFGEDRRSYDTIVELPNYKDLFNLFMKYVAILKREGKINDAASLLQTIDILTKADSRLHPVLVEVPIINSIFAPDGYRDKISRLNKLLHPSKGEDKMKIAANIRGAIKLLDEISDNAENQVAFSTPLRAFLASKNLYPREHINLRADQKDDAITYLEKAVFNLKAKLYIE